MHLEDFAEGDSFFHRLDPRVKCTTLAPYIFTVAVADSLAVPVTALFFSIGLTLFAALDKKKLLNRLIVVNLFLFMLWVFIPFSFPGKELFMIGPFTATREGFIYVLSIAAKCNSIMLATVTLLGTSHIFSLAHAFIHLKAPKKLVYLFFFFYRYISVLHEEFERLKRSMTVRSFKPGTNLHTYKTYAYLVGMLIVNSYDRSQRIYNAMLCRGFSGKFPVIHHFHLRTTDMLFGLGMSMVTLLFFVYI